MTDTRDNLVREAVYEIVNSAPIAPSVDDLAMRRTPHQQRSPLLVATIVVLVVAAGAALATRLDKSADTGTTTTAEPSTSTALTPQLTAPEAFRILRQSQAAAIGNMDTLAGPLIRDCMAAQGFTFIPNSTSLMGEQSQSDFLRQRYPEPRQQDGMWGYEFDSTSTVENSQPIETPSPDSALPGYFDAIQGTTILTSETRDFDGHLVTQTRVGDGCSGQAMATIFGSPQAYITFFSTLNQLEVTTGSTYYNLRTDPDYVARNQSWSQCMKDAGFDYPTIFDPENRDWPSPRPTPLEQRVAEADSVCLQGRQLARQDLFVLEERALGAVLAEHPLGDLTKFDRQVQALLAGRLPSTNQSPASTTTP
jgi:hypothetical protein